MDFHAVVAKRRGECFAAVSSFLCPAACSPPLGVSAVVYAQLESGDRGILPIDSSGTLEISGHPRRCRWAATRRSARYAGWRIAQRQGFRALWAKMHNAPIDQAPNLPDGTLDQIVSSINVEREQIGPNRYIADLGVLFDRARAAPFLGVEGGQVQRSAPMLLIPVHRHRGHGDERRAAQCVAARLGAVPHLAKPDRLCPGQRHRRRPAADQCGADGAARAAAGGATCSISMARRHPRRRGPAAAALSRRAGARAVHRAARARQSRSSAASR